MVDNRFYSDQNDRNQRKIGSAILIFVILCLGTSTAVDWWDGRLGGLLLDFLVLVVACILIQKAYEYGHWNRDHARDLLDREEASGTKADLKVFIDSLEGTEQDYANLYKDWRLGGDIPYPSDAEIDPYGELIRMRIDAIASAANVPERARPVAGKEEADDEETSTS